LKEEELSLSFACTANPEGCGADYGYLFVTEKFHPDFQDHESNRVKISVSTSAGPRGNSIDFQATPVPFVVYAKVLPPFYAS